MIREGAYFDVEPRFYEGSLPRLVGFGGWAESGKDAAADYLASLGYKRANTSGPLEEALLKIDPWIPVPRRTPEDWIRYSALHAQVGYVASKKNPEVRRLLQKLGTEVGRDMVDADVWVNIVFAKVSRWLAEGSNVAITAMRYPNELRVLKSLGGVAVWVDRPGLTPVNDHSSDNSVTAEMFDVVLRNDGALADLGPAILATLTRNR